MQIVDIIRKKRDGGKLSRAEIDFWLAGCAQGTVADYQSAALLMACFIRGLNDAETLALTEGIARSGERLTWHEIEGIKVDKHSSGGVGDKITPILIPVLAATGLKVIKMSGRGLGHTGGTIDKMESIEGYRSDYTMAELKELVAQSGMALVGQSADLTPADGVLYSLRDLTATVDSVTLVAASIVGKKLAIGADIVVFDVKYGSGSFFADSEEAQKLAWLMVRLMRAAGKKAVAVLSSMEQPLGYAVGNALEIKEAVEVLQGNGPADVRRLVQILAGEVFFAAGTAPTRELGRELALHLLDTGLAYQQFVKLVEGQGGDSDFSRLSKSQLVMPFTAKQSGFIAAIDAERIGRAVLALDAGRERREDYVDHATGLVLAVKCGDSVQEGDILAYVHCRNERQYKAALPELAAAYTIGVEAVAIPELISAIIA